MKKFIIPILLLTLASCQKIQLPLPNSQKVNSNYFGNVTMQNNYSGFWYQGKAISYSSNFDTLFVKIETSTIANDYEFVTAITDGTNAKIIQWKSIQPNNIVTSGNVSASGLITMNKDSIYIDAIYTNTNNTQQFLGKK